MIFPILTTFAIEEPIEARRVVHKERIRRKEAGE
jgi:hypothetical protein